MLQDYGKVLKEDNYGNFREREEEIVGEEKLMPSASVCRSFAFILFFPKYQHPPVHRNAQSSSHICAHCAVSLVLYDSSKDTVKHSNQIPLYWRNSVTTSRHKGSHKRLHTIKTLAI